MNLFNDFLNTISDTEVTTTSAIFKLMLSLLLGGIVGFERKRKGQVAGARTFALISMGATLAMIISIYIPQVYWGLKNVDREGKIIHLKAADIVEDLTRYEKLLGEYEVSLHNVLVEYDYSEQKTDLKFIILSRSTTDFVSLFSHMRNIYRTEYISLQNEI